MPRDHLLSYHNPSSSLLINTPATHAVVSPLNVFLLLLLSPHFFFFPPHHPPAPPPPPPHRPPPPKHNPAGRPPPRRSSCLLLLQPSSWYYCCLSWCSTAYASHCHNLMLMLYYRRVMLAIHMLIVMMFDVKKEVPMRWWGEVEDGAGTAEGRGEWGEGVGSAGSRKST